MRRVEVVVRFAGDLVDVIRVRAGSVYSIGTASVVAKAGTKVTVGLVTISITDATDACTGAVPRKRVEARPYVFLGASLGAHVALVAIAFALTADPISAPAIELAQPKQRGATRIKDYVTNAHTITQAPEPVAVVTPPDPAQADRIDTDTPAPAVVREFAPSEMSGGGLTTGPKDGDGTSERFDPSADPAFATIKSGDYSTASTGRAAGDEYSPLARNSSLVVITCDRFSCLVLGGEKAARIRRAVEERTTELTDCYKKAAESGGGSVEIDFGVDAAGAVKNVDVGEVDTAGMCVAKIIRTLKIEDESEAG